MKNLIFKELKLSTPLLTYLFLGFAVMTFVPGYPILLGAFFVCLGIFQGYQIAREYGDMEYSILLPVKKIDVVKGKYFAVCLLQLVAFFLMLIFTLIRMTFLSEAIVYEKNALMGANFVFLGFVLIMFAIFNVVFLGGFFKTAYNMGKYFIFFIILSFLVIISAEVLHHIPKLEWMNTLDYGNIGGQIAVLLLGIVLYLGITIISCRKAQKRFDKIDF